MPQLEEELIRRRRDELRYVWLSINLYILCQTLSYLFALVISYSIFIINFSLFSVLKCYNSFHTFRTQ